MNAGPVAGGGGALETAAGVDWTRPVAAKMTRTPAGWPAGVTGGPLVGLLTAAPGLDLVLLALGCNDGSGARTGFRGR